MAKSVSVRYGGRSGRRQRLYESTDMVVVRSGDALSARAAARSRAGQNALNDLYEVVNFPDAKAQVLRSKVKRHGRLARDRLRSALSSESRIRFAGKVLRDPGTNRPVIYTENLFVQFAANVGREQRNERLAEFGLAIKEELPYAENAFFVGAPVGTGLGVFAISDALLDNKQVALCHPELIREARGRSIFAPQWHLGETVLDGHRINAHSKVERAWTMTTGAGIVIAVIDDGVDISHPELGLTGKVVAPRDISRGINDPSPKFSSNTHGTPCAGVACASGAVGASGVAPDALLMPIRVATRQLGTHAEAMAFYWAANNGADVISCSWGAPDGEWSDPQDPLHAQVTPLPDDTRLAIEYAATQGRGGRGCVITFAAGNGNEPVENDGYASCKHVLSVAACNDRGFRSAYSDFGLPILCCFPSDDFELDGHVEPGFNGIWTTDRVGLTQGLNPKLGQSEPSGDYTHAFGGTSSACPGVAGVVALMLNVRPQLTCDQVRSVIAATCDPIDCVGGGYTASGHSPFYGFGRINAARAVEMAISIAV